MISRSNCASAPNRWNTNRPPAVMVSMLSREQATLVTRKGRGVDRDVLHIGEVHDCF